MKQSVSERKTHIGRAEKITVKKQCELLQISRSSHYYQKAPESDFNLKLMEMIDREFMEHPWKGVPRMVQWLRKDCGFLVNKKRVERLYRVMGISASAPGPGTSKKGKGKGHKVFPYLLKNLPITHPNQVWAMDITYIPVKGGYLYLVAIIDLYSRYVVGWSLSNTMTAEWCRDVLDEALENYGKPEIINTDQGSQFTSDLFTEYVKSHKTIRQSMDGKGRALDNIFIERLWRSVKYENVYLYAYQDGKECYGGLKKYFAYYNHKRRHQSLNYEVPQTIYNLTERKAA